MRRTLVAAAVTAGVIGGSVAVAAISPLGFAIAQEGEVTPVPDAPGFPREDGPIQSALDSLVEDGTLTPEEADAVIDRIGERIAELPRGPGGPGGPLGHHPGPGGHGEIADILGVEPDALFEALRAGESLAEVAEANGVDPQTVIDALVASATERIDQAVENGWLDGDQAEEAKAGLAESITARVNGEAPEGGFGPGMHGGPGFGGRPGGFGPGGGFPFGESQPEAQDASA